jgi:putative transposase
MTSFIDDHRDAYAVEPIRKLLPIAASTYYEHAARKADPDRGPNRAWRDEALAREIRRVWAKNLGAFGVRKVSRQLRREGFRVARCTVERLMRRPGLQGGVRGKPRRTTISDKAQACPLDEVHRQFRAERPNLRWVGDFTYVSTRSRFIDTAFVIDIVARRIVGWKASRTTHTDFVLDARRPSAGSLNHHGDRGAQCVSIRSTERLRDAGIEPSVGSVGDSYDNALAETIIGL